MPKVGVPCRALRQEMKKFWLTEPGIHVMLLMILRDNALQSLFKAIYSGPPNGAKAIRTAGSTADRRRKLPLLIEFLRFGAQRGPNAPCAGARIAAFLAARTLNFISWFLYNHEIAHPMRRLVKRSIRVVKV